MGTKNSTMICDLDFLLIGKTGSGKSSTGNSILGRKAFKVSHGSISCTTWSKSRLQTLTTSTRTISVTDIPGLFDVKQNNDIHFKKLNKFLLAKIFPLVEGFHTFLFTVQFGQRFTNEDKECISILKMTFGENFVKDHTVCVITRGDEFKKKEKRSFDKWVRNERGVLGELFKECDYRCVLFNNDAETDIEKSAQIELLLTQVHRIKDVNKVYTPHLFELAKVERDEAIKKKEIPRITELIKKNMAQLNEIFDKIVTCEEEDKDKICDELKEILKKIKELLKQETFPSIFRNNSGLADLEKNFDEIREHRNWRSLILSERQNIFGVWYKVRQCFNITAKFLASGGMVLSLIPHPISMVVSAVVLGASAGITAAVNTVDMSIE